MSVRNPAGSVRDPVSVLSGCPKSGRECPVAVRLEQVCRCRQLCAGPGRLGRRGGGCWWLCLLTARFCTLYGAGAGLGEFGALRGRVLGSLGSVSAQGWVEVGALARGWEVGALRGWVLGSLGSVLDLQDVR